VRDSQYCLCVSMRILIDLHLYRPAGPSSGAAARSCMGPVRISDNML
jgi:hypothetical protein